MYQALYRKYRPLVFEDVIGQEHVVSTVKNQIQNNKSSHAYMFTGTRGTGKTTCAKIFARAVNCENPVDGNPCNECPTCKSILNGSLLDVFEIDAASNNGVDNIRELREDVIFTPADAKYKVYIIDEVHMLSTQAFNALLKTLEEPPEHVKFVFATTEINKVPQTILSRCQRFDFKRITTEDIFKRLNYVAECEKIELEPAAASLISKLADGALRDALSILDRCINISGKITLQDVENTVGICPYELIIDVLKAVSECDSETVLKIYSQLRRNSKDAISFFSELCSYLRDLMIIKLTKNASAFLSYDDEKFKALSKLSEAYTKDKILRSIDVLQEGIYDISKLKDKHIIAEMTLIKLTNIQIGNDYESLSERVSNLENGTAVVNCQPNIEKKEKVVAKKIVQKPITNNNISSPSTNNVDFWDEVIGMLGKIAGPSITAILKKFDVNINGDNIFINCPADGFERILLSKSENIEYIKESVKRITGKDYAIIFSDAVQHKNISQNDPFDQMMSDAGEILYKE